MADAAEQGAPPFPVYPLIQPEVVRQKRRPYEGDLKGRALVIDNGSYSCKAGWSGEDAPRVRFRSVTCRPRNRGTSQQRACVGDWGPGLKGWDFGKHAIRGVFDGDIPYQMEAQEQLLDWAFDRLSITGGSVQHPVLMTHPPLGPASNKAALAQLLFEAYGVPAVQFAAPGPCAFHYYAAQGRVGPSGIVISSGHSSTYITVMYKGEPQEQHCCRSSICGALAVQHLQQLLLLRYPQHASVLTLPVVEGLKARYCYCAKDYSQELRAMQAEPATAGGRAVGIQLPWTPPKLITPEEAAAAAAAKEAKLEEQRRRMKDMAARRRQAALEEKEDHLEFLEQIAEGLDEVSDDVSATRQLLGQAQVHSRAELGNLISEAQQKVEKLRAAVAKAEAGNEEEGTDAAIEPSPAPASPSPALLAEKEGSVNPSSVTPAPSDWEGTAGLVASAETADSEATKNGQAKAEGGEEAVEVEGAAGGEVSVADEVKKEVAGQKEEEEEGFELVGVPDSELTEEQKKLKRRQQLLKGSRDARVRAKARKEQEEQDKAARAAEEDAAHDANPQRYIAALKRRHAAVSAKLEAKKRKRLGLVDPAAQAAAALTRRGRRTGVEQRERMRLMAQAVQDTKRGKRGGARGGAAASDSDDSFGEEDDDWDVYKHMKGGSDSDEGAEDEAEYAWTTDRLRQLGALGPSPTAAPPPPPGEAAASRAASEGPGALPQAAWAQSMAALDPAAAAGLVGAPAPGMVLAGVGPEGYLYRPLTAEDFQVVLGVERVRVPELLLQPPLAGVDQAGLSEIVMALLKRMPAEMAEEVAEGGLLLTGGNAAFEGLASRVEAELTACRPLGKPMKLVASEDPVCDAWKGVSLLAHQPGTFSKDRGALTLEDYEEKGVDYLQEFNPGLVFPLRR